ncbi:MAG: transcriptional regulator [Planctomycetota bacterium]
MRDVRRLEVVIDAVHVDELLRRMREAGVEGYTVIRGAAGWGDRGTRLPDGVSGVFENCVVLCAIAPETEEAVGSAVAPVLKRFGGVALVSDARMVTP